MKIAFSSQREMLLFLITSMATVTSRANQHYTVLYCIRFTKWSLSGPWIKLESVSVRINEGY